MVVQQGIWQITIEAVVGKFAKCESVKTQTYISC